LGTAYSSPQGLFLGRSIILISGNNADYNL
jgi:hypothetical protein